MKFLGAPSNPPGSADMTVDVLRSWNCSDSIVVNMAFDTKS